MTTTTYDPSADTRGLLTLVGIVLAAAIIVMSVWSIAGISPTVHSNPERIADLGTPVSAIEEIALIQQLGATAAEARAVTAPQSALDEVRLIQSLGGPAGTPEPTHINPMWVRHVQ